LSVASFPVLPAISDYLDLHFVVPFDFSLVFGFSFSFCLIANKVWTGSQKPITMTTGQRNTNVKVFHCRTLAIRSGLHTLMLDPILSRFYKWINSGRRTNDYRGNYVTKLRLKTAISRWMAI